LRSPEVALNIVAAVQAMDSSLLPAYLAFTFILVLASLGAAVFASAAALRFAARRLTLPVPSRRRELLAGLSCAAAALAVVFAGGQELPWQAVLLVGLVAGGLACAWLEESFSAELPKTLLLFAAGAGGFLLVAAAGFAAAAWLALNW
jgi:hypothetical protein